MFYKSSCLLMIKSNWNIYKCMWLYAYYEYAYPINFMTNNLKFDISVYTYISVVCFV